MRDLRSNRGFTLIELMIVVAIVALLAAIAIPFYQDYVKRARMAEVVLAASACRTRVSEVYQSGGSTAPTAGNWGCEKSAPASTYVQVITTDANGKILVTAKNFGDSAIDGKILTLAPLIDGGPAAVPGQLGRAVTLWRCGSPADGTTIPPNVLPSSCIGS